MDTNTTLIVLISILPGILVAVIAYVLIEKFLNNENLRRQMEIQKISTDHITPQRLSAYERMALFLERIKPTALIRRISAQSTAKNYEVLLIQAIQSKWEHNLSQQIYVSPETWKIIYSAKNATQNFIRECAEELGEDASAQEFQEYIVKKSIEEISPSDVALLTIHVDIQGGNFYEINPTML